MSPDDKRGEPDAVEKHAELGASGNVETGESVADDLEALSVAGDLSSQSPSDPAKESEEESNLGALAAVSMRRSAVTEDDDSRLDLGQLVAVAQKSLPPGAPAATGVDAPTAPASQATLAAAQTAPLIAAPSTRPSWVMPLLLGLGIGLGLAGGLYALGVTRVGTASTGVANVASPPAPSAGPGVAAAAATPEPTPAADPAASPRGSPTARPPLERALANTNTTAPHASASPRALPAPANAVSISHISAAPQPTAAAPAAPSPTAGAAPKPVLPGEETPAAAEPEASAKNASSPSMDTLLDEALSPSARRAAAEHARELALQTDQLPLTPTRDDVTQAMTVLLPAIHGCAMGQSGMATAGIVVRGDGRVASVEVAGAPFAGSASGRCMEGVIRRAHFPRFKQPAFRIRFPLAIQ